MQKAALNNILVIMTLFVRRTLPLFLLAACIIFAVGFSGIFIFDNLDHEHTSGDCSVCLQIEAALTLLKNLLFAALAVFVAALFRSAYLFRKSAAPQSVSFLSPIVLKVKLSR